MPGHVSLQRSCNTCIKVKRRCDLGTPRCGRCRERSLQCSYHNEPLAARPPQALLSSRVSKKTSTGRPGSRPRWEPDFSLVQAKHMPHADDYAPPLPAFARLPSFALLGTLSPATQQYLDRMFCRFPQKLSEQGYTSFIHENFFKHSLEYCDPTVRAVLDACAVSRTPFQRGPPRRQSRVIGHSTVVQTRTIDLIRRTSATSCSVQSILCATQTLILSLVPQLFWTENQPPSQSQPQVDNSKYLKLALHTLHKWKMSLYTSAPWAPPSGLYPSCATAFIESIRRTIIVAGFVISLVSVKARGFYEASLFAVALPFTMNKPWKPLLRNESARSTPTCAEDTTENLMSFRELHDLFAAGALVGRERECREFERMLLAATVGVENLEMLCGRDMVWKEL